MSGGAFDYFQKRYEWKDAMEKISMHLTENPNEYSKYTLEEFEYALGLIKKAQIYMQRIDWLISDDDGEESFHRRLKEDLEQI